jgi:hypothetical protein
MGAVSRKLSIWAALECSPAVRTEMSKYGKSAAEGLLMKNFDFKYISKFGHSSQLLGFVAWFIYFVFEFKKI